MIEIKAKPCFATNRIEYLYKAMIDEKHADTFFTVRDRNFSVHMVVLSASSEILKKNTNNLSAIFSDYEYEVVEAMLTYCYLGDIYIDDQYFEKFKELATKLQIQNIVPKCEIIDLTNCLEVLTLSDDVISKEKALSMTVDNFKTLYKTPSFLNLPFIALIEIFKSDELNVSAEEMFNSVKLWINSDVSNRRKHLVKLLSFANLQLLSMKFFITEVTDFCSPYLECNSILQQTMKTIFINFQSDYESKLEFAEQKVTNSQIKLSTVELNLKDSQSKLSAVEKSLLFTEEKLNNCKILIKKKEITKNDKIALIGDNHIPTANIVDIYDGRNNIWIQSRNYNFQSRDFASVLVNNWIMIIGGIDPSNKVDYIDLTDGQKHSLNPLNQGRYYFSAVTHHRGYSIDVYAIGGFDGKYLSTVEKWNNKTMNWDPNIAPLPQAVCWHSASVIDDRIYVTGGEIHKDGVWMSCNELQVYSVETNSWSFGTAMNQRRRGHSSITSKGRLYVGGGYDFGIKSTLDSVESYDPNANIWTSYCTLPKPAEGISLCIFRNKLICIGGFDGEDKLNNVWEYENSTKSWKSLPNLNESKRLANAIVIPYDSII